MKQWIRAMVLVSCFAAANISSQNPPNNLQGELRNPGDSYFEQVRAIAIDPLNHSVLYVGTSYGEVFKSMDGGEIWTPASVGLPGQSIQALAINPSDTSTIYAGTDGGVYKTTNAAENWTSVDSGRENLQIYSMVIDPSNPEIVYGATFGGRVFKTVNGGATWVAHSLGVRGTFVTALAINGQNPSTIYAATGGDNHHVPTYGIFKSTDGAETWNAINSGFPVKEWIFSMVVSPSAPDTIYVGTGWSRGLYKSIDGGKQWFLLEYGPNLSGQTIRALAVDPANPSKLYFGYGGGLGGYGGIAKSSDGGESVNLSHSGLPNEQVSELAIDPVESSTIYAGTERGVFKSKDGGQNWQAMGSARRLPNE